VKAAAELARARKERAANFMVAMIEFMTNRLTFLTTKLKMSTTEDPMEPSCSLLDWPSSFYPFPAILAY
jgi:hypothetical protein